MTHCDCNSIAPRLERRTLGLLLLINGVLFAVECAAGWIAESTGLLADSLDMLADAIVYGAAMYASGRSDQLQRKTAIGSGFIQIALGLGVLAEVVRRMVVGSEPESLLMMIVGGVALLANISCLLLLAKYRKGGQHLRASWIFSANDVMANLGVVVSGFAVQFFQSGIPDLLIGTLISIIVVYGGCRILKQANSGSE